MCAFLFATLSTSTGAGATARTAKGDGPSAIVAAFGSIWVGTGGGLVIRMDAGTMRVQSVFRGQGFVHALDSGFGSIWALQDRVVRIDPERGKTKVLAETGSATTFDLAAGDDAVWVADDGRDVVDLIDPRLTKRTAAIRVPGRAFGRLQVTVACSSSRFRSVGR